MQLWKHEELDLGLVGSLILSFADVLLQKGHYPYRLSYDIFFTSVKLMSALKKKGIKATGSICENRTGKCPLMNVEHMKKMNRGILISGWKKTKPLAW